MFSLIVCSDNIGTIGIKNEGIPWHNSTDLKNFKEKTAGNIVIMGRKTWDSLPSQFRPLPNRINVIISSNGYSILDGIDKKPVESLSYGNKLLKYKKLNSPILIFEDINSAIIELAKKKYDKNEKFIIGGATIYEYFMNAGLVHKIYHTENYESLSTMVDYIKFDIKSYINENWNIINNFIINNININLNVDKTTNWSYNEYIYVNHEEQRFLDLINKVLETGETRYDRTETGTLALFSPCQLEFDLTDGKFPLITTRQLSLRMIFEELMLFLRGQTDNQILIDKKVPIWIGNTTREFLDAYGLSHLEENDMGETYGFLYRHFGAKYNDCHTDYTGQGYDQVAEVIRLLKDDPYSRRIIISLWNPNSLKNCSLPACAYQYQFFVSFKNGQGYLSTKLCQRSSDICTAGGWNIAAASLLTYLLASVTGLKPLRVIWSPADTHIYLNLVEQAKEQLKRTPKIFPRLLIKGNAPSIVNGRDITEFEFSDLELLNYKPYGVIKMTMNV